MQDMSYLKLQTIYNQERTDMVHKAKDMPIQPKVNLEEIAEEERFQKEETPVKAGIQCGCSRV